MNGEPPPKKEAPSTEGATKDSKDWPEVATAKGTAQARKLPPGAHRGFDKLKSQPGVYRTKLYPDIRKGKPEHADYKGVLQIANGKASVLVWVHADGTLGFRLEKITEDRRKEQSNGRDQRG